MQYSDLVSLRLKYWRNLPLALTGYDLHQSQIKDLQQGVTSTVETPLLNLHNPW